MKSMAVKKVYGSIAMALQVPFTFVQYSFDPAIVAYSGLTKVQFTPTWSIYLNGSSLIIAELSDSVFFVCDCSNFLLSCCGN